MTNKQTYAIIGALCFIILVFYFHRTGFEGHYVLDDGARRIATFSISKTNLGQYKRATVCRQTCRSGVIEVIHSDLEGDKIFIHGDILDEFISDTNWSVYTSTHPLFSQRDVHIANIYYAWGRPQIRFNKYQKLGFRRLYRDGYSPTFPWLHRPIDKSSYRFQ